MSVGTIYENFDDLKSLIERHKNEKVPCKNYEFDGTGYALMLKDINKLLQENQQLKRQKEINDKVKKLILLKILEDKEETDINVGEV